jgi:predicted CXXCH cytochrome family protein
MMRMKHPIIIWREVILLVGLVLMSQCSPHAGKSILHIFFDGVPETDSIEAEFTDTGTTLPAEDAISQELAVLPETVIYRHYPYEEQECASCHDELSLGLMVESQPGLCYSCHEDFAGSFGYLHGPVAGGYCTACHDPHQSEKDHLLRLNGNALCFYCHLEESVLENDMHADLDGMLCMDCHNPHGGEDKYIFQ